MLTDEGVLLLKVLLVLSIREQKRRLKALAKRTGGASRVLEEWAEVKRREAGRPGGRGGGPAHQHGPRALDRPALR